MLRVKIFQCESQNQSTSKATKAETGENKIQEYFKEQLKGIFLCTNDSFKAEE